MRASTNESCHTIEKDDLFIYEHMYMYMYIHTTNQHSYYTHTHLEFAYTREASQIFARPPQITHTHAKHYTSKHT